MGEHIDNRKGAGRRREEVSETVDVKTARRRKATFKGYLRELEDELHESELDDDAEDDE